MKKYSEVFKNISLVTQLGLSLIMPVLLCLFLCWLLVTKAGAGNWIYIIGFVFGLGGSAATCYKLWHSITQRKDGEKDDQGGRIGFNDHL